MSYLLYEPFDHWEGSNSEPWGDETTEIYGVELEIGVLLDADLMNQYIEDGIIETKETASAPIQLEEEAQSDVQYELVFNADEKSSVLDRISSIIDLRHDCDQHEEVSCHIHMNRYHIEENLGLDEMDIYKATEAIAPFIWAISGRNNYSWEQWSPNRIDRYLDPIERLKYIDNVTPKSQKGNEGTRYDCCNLAPYKTIEIRGFSNYYNFNMDLIEVYMDVVSDLIPNIAMEMQTKTYKEQGLKALEMLQRFIKRHSTVLYQYFDLSFIMNIDIQGKLLEMKERALNEAIERYNSTKYLFDEAKEALESGDTYEAARIIIQALKYNKALKLDAIKFDELEDTIKELMEMNQRAFKNAVWRA